MSRWEVKKLGDLCNIQLGKTPARRNPKFWDAKHQSDNVWISIADMRHGEVLSTSKERLTRLGAAECKVTPRGTLLLSFKLTLGRVSFAGRNLYTNEAIASLLNLKVDKNYLFYYFSHFDWMRATEGDHKIKGRTLNKAKLKDLSIPVPPLSVQREIVDRLDAAFALLDKAEANVRRCIELAEELWEGVLESLFDAKDERWIETDLSCLLRKKYIIDHMDGNHGGNYPRKSEFVLSGVPYLSAKNIKDGHVDFYEAKFLSYKRAAKLRKGFAKNGDVLFAHNATVGPVAILNTDYEVCVLGTSLTYYRPNLSYVLPEYLAAYMRSPLFVRQYNQVMRQSTRNQVPITKQRTFTFLIPPLQVQRNMLTALVAFYRRVQIIKSSYKVQAQNISVLRASILGRVFSQELIP